VAENKQEKNVILYRAGLAAVFAWLFFAGCSYYFRFRLEPLVFFTGVSHFFIPSFILSIFSTFKNVKDGTGVYEIKADHKKINIKDLNPDEIRRKIIGLGCPAYRAGQIFRWVYEKGTESFDEMTDLPGEFRDKLKKCFIIGSIRPFLNEQSKSADGTTKVLYRLSDGEIIESVIIPSGDECTVCVSTQAGCRFRCAFCASGMSGFRRNLSPGEIVDQVLLAKAGGCRVTRVVFMGIGEPLDNYDNLTRAVRILNHKNGLNIGARKMTVSTCGLPDGIRKLSGLGLQIELSVSLHAAYDKLRQKLMPVAKHYKLERLISALEDFIRRTKRKITFEYVLIKGVNDSDDCAVKLSGLAHRLKAKVNLIPMSPVKGSDMESSVRAGEFLRILARTCVPATIRRSRGADINAACGQLRRQHDKFLSK